MTGEPPVADYQSHLGAAARELAQQDFYFFARYMFFKRRGYKWLRNWHHEVICEALMAVYRGEITRLIINIPPRYSKTELAVVNFIAWCLGKNPDCEFIETSYAQPLAARNSWEARELVAHPAFRELFPDFTGLRTDSTARHDWRTEAGGCVYATGAQGTITGYGAGKERPGFGGAIIIDDPHKADEADSETVREGVLNWFQNTLESRKNSKQTPIILIMQRLHERDLTGFLLAGGNGEKWEHICIPAEPLPGEALWPLKHSIEQLRVMETAAPYIYSGQYMQSPTPPSGGTIKPEQIQILETLPADIEWCRGWDFAGTEERAGTDPDHTAGVKIGRSKSNPNRFFIGDVTRMRGLPHEVEATLVNTATLDGLNTKISIPQDPGQAGKHQVTYFTGKLAGFNVTSSPETGDKVTRATPMAAQINVGNFAMLKADWNQQLINEFRFFPKGSHDDIVDGAARAFNELTGVRANGLDYLRLLVQQQQAAAAAQGETDGRG